jgi:hypothetical protein
VRFYSYEFFCCIKKFFAFILGAQMTGGFDLEAWTAGDVSFASSGHQQRSTINQGDPIINNSVLTNQGYSHNASSQLQREGDWICLSCSTVNFAKRTRCNKCGAIKNKRGITYY